MRITVSFYLTMLIILVTGNFVKAQTAKNKCRLAAFSFEDNRSFFDTDIATRRALLAVNTLPKGIEVYDVKDAKEVPEGGLAIVGTIDYLDTSYGHLNNGTYTNVVVSRKSGNGFIIQAKGVAVNFSNFVFEDFKIFTCTENGLSITSIK